MKKIIEINNLSFRYKSKFVFDKFNLSINEGEWLSIVGPNGSGKTTLIKLIIGLLPSDNCIKIDDLILNKDNLAHVRKRISILFESDTNYFVGETVAEEIAFPLENLAYSQSEMQKMVHRIADLLKISHLLDKDPATLSGGEKQKVALASALVSNPKILIMDGNLEMVDTNTKKEIFNLLEQLNKNKSLTVINFSRNLDEVYHADRLVIIKDGSILIDGPIKTVLKEDKIFNRIGIEVPFMVDLSIKLQLYALIDKMIFNMDEMVDVLWQ
ncbi:MAG TPA: ATP-binding cassette domain-containing protein [Mollicutes bacterium]|jgi:energy-coupling factor transport system ATP-binding protein|nr:ATP-binding cassette domain-containing protein [Mollicutes bacterium]